MSLSEETVGRLRSTVEKRYGGRRGALSGIIEETLKQHLGRIETPKQVQTFEAIRDGKIVAQAEDLGILASKLRNAGVDPRTVRIISTRGLPHVIRAGLPAKRA